MKQKISKTLPCGITVVGEVYSPSQLSAKFQIKAGEYGLTDSESLALWFEGDKAKIRIYFKPSVSDYAQFLSSGKTKLANAPKNWEV